MLRRLLLGLLLVGLGYGFQREWIRIDFPRLASDLNMPYLADPDPLRRLPFIRWNQ